MSVNGDGEQTHDYVYVGDVVNANLLATEATLGAKVPILNIGTGVGTSVNDLVRLLEQLVGRGIRGRHDPPRPGEQRRSALDAGLAKRFLRCEPATEIREGLAQTFHWFREKLGA